MQNTRKKIKKVVKSFVRKIYPMDLNDILYGPEINKITQASADTYNILQLSQLGLQLTINTSANKVQWVGDQNNKVYPQIVVWKPDYIGANTGKAIVAEVIETGGSLLTPNVQKWRILAGISGLHFNLIVPNDRLSNVREALRQNNILSGVNLQTWKLDSTSNNYIFTKD